MMAEIAVPTTGRFGIASGDHSMNSQITSAYIDSMGEKAGVAGVAKDLRTYRREFDEGNLSVIGQVDLKVGKKMRVKNMLTGDEEIVDTLVSPQGRPAEYFMYEGEEEGKVYTELLDKYHAVAQSSDDITAVWVSHKDITEENVGRNVRIFKLEKKDSDVVLTSYTAGGSKESGWRFMEGLIGKKRDRSSSLHGATAFFDQPVEHKKVYDILVDSLTAEEKVTSKRYLEKFQQETLISDDVRGMMNEQEEVRIKKEILEHPDVITGIGMYAQALSALVELSRKTYLKPDSGKDVRDQKEQEALDEKSAEGIVLLAKYRQLLSSLEQAGVSLDVPTDIQPTLKSFEKEQIDHVDILPLIPALIYFTQHLDDTDVTLHEIGVLAVSEKTEKVNELMSGKNTLLMQDPVGKPCSSDSQDLSPFRIEIKPLPFSEAGLLYHKQGVVPLPGDNMVQIKSDRNSSDYVKTGGFGSEMENVVNFSTYEVLSFSEKAFISVDIAHVAELFLNYLSKSIPQLFENNGMDSIQSNEMILQFIQFITSNRNEKSDILTQKYQEKILQRLSILTSLVDHAKHIPHIDTIMTFLFFAAVADYTHHISNHGLAGTHESIGKYMKLQEVFAVSDKDMESFYHMAGHILHIDFKTEYSYQQWRQIILDALFAFVQELLIFAAEYKDFQLNGSPAQKKQHTHFTIERLAYQSRLKNQFAQAQPVNQSRFPQTGLIYIYMLEPLPLIGNV